MISQNGNSHAWVCSPRETPRQPKTSIQRFLTMLHAVREELRLTLQGSRTLCILVTLVMTAPTREKFEINCFGQYQPKYSYEG